MDQTEFNPQNPGICHKLLVSILPIDCPVCTGIAICSRLFNFIARAAPSPVASTLFPRIFGGILDHVLLIFQRLYDSIMQILVVQAKKPLRLGSFKDQSSTEMPNFHAPRAENETQRQTTKDQTTKLAPNQDLFMEKDYRLMIEESQAKEVDGTCSSYGHPRDDRVPSQVTDTTDDGGGDYCSSSLVQEKFDKEEQEKVPTLTVTPKAKAPKKMVSINENVEVFPISNCNRVMSKEWPSAIGSDAEKSKPLKSILKVGSKLINTE